MKSVIKKILLFVMVLGVFSCSPKSDSPANGAGAPGAGGAEVDELKGCDVKIESESTRAASMSWYKAKSKCGLSEEAFNKATTNLQ